MSTPSLVGKRYRHKVYTSVVMTVYRHEEGKVVLLNDALPNATPVLMLTIQLDEHYDEVAGEGM